MGLMYIFPVSTDDHERTEIITKANQKTLVLKSYGLPMIFWGYLTAALIVVAAMWLASKSSIEKLLTYKDDPSLIGLAFLVHYTLILIPIILIGFFFYEKHLQKSGNILTIIYKIFFIPFFYKIIILDSKDSFQVNHFMDSPNVAKIHNSEQLKQFENKGYFELYALSKGKKIVVDRHSRKADLIKIKELLSKF